MPILAQNIDSRVRASLDAEEADYYTANQDVIPAINQSVEWLIIVFNEIFGKKKGIPEQLRELIKTRVWQANAYSRVSYNEADTGHKLWTILAVMPKPVLYPSNSSSPLTNKVQSRFMPNKSFLSSDFSATRLSTEQWSINTKNPFVPGNNAIKNGLTEYAYKDFSDYSSSSYSNPVAPEIEIKPAIPEEYVAIEYLKYPTPITLLTQSLEFPESMTQIITEKTLSFLANKQGDNTTIWSVAEGDIKRITGLLS